MIENEILLFPNGVGEDIRVDEHFLVGDGDWFGIYAECCLYSFLFTRHLLVVLSNSLLGNLIFFVE